VRLRRGDDIAEESAILLDDLRDAIDVSDLEVRGPDVPHHSLSRIDEYRGRRIDIALRNLDESRGRWMKPDPNGLPSSTTWTVMGRGSNHTWLALEPLTGRTHQLRVHCAEMGWPILGDNIYGRAPRTGGPVLHLQSREVVVPLYKNKDAIKVTAPVPTHMREQLAACGWKD
jgi:tRNA pseudouridine32 synthase/23S rRNA pseudouridine746 synthase